MKMDIGNEIRELNLSYLMLAQQMIMADKAGAMFKLGIGVENLGPVGRVFPFLILAPDVGEFLCVASSPRLVVVGDLAKLLHLRAHFCERVSRSSVGGYICRDLGN